MKRLTASKQFPRWLGKNCHIGMFILLLCAIILWDTRVLHPPMVTNLAGFWEARGCEEKGAGCEPWRGVQVPGHFVASSPRTNPVQRVEFKKRFVSPAECALQTCKVIFAEVGDTLDVVLNGTPLRMVGPTNKVPYEKNYALGMDIPPDLLSKGQPNEIVASVRSLKRDQTGLRMAPIGIVSQTVGLHFIHGKTFHSLYLPLLCSVLTCVSALLLKISTKSHLPLEVMTAFDSYALASALFLVSFSEISRQLITFNVAIPLHFFLRFFADFTLLSFLSLSVPQYWGHRLARGAYITSLVAFSTLITFGLISSAENIASIVYDVVRIANPTCATGFLILALALLNKRLWPQAAASMVAWGVIIHDYCVGSGYLQSEFISKYHHAFIAFGAAILLARRAGRQQEIARAQADAQQHLADISRQVAHDVQSPLQALKIVAQLATSLPEEPKSLMSDAIARIETIVQGMRGSMVRLILPADDTPVALAPILLASLREAKARYQHKSFVWHTDLEDIEHCCVRVNVSVFRQVLSNLLTNAVESLGNGSQGKIALVGRTGPGGRVRLALSDNGCGIPSSVLARLGQRGVTHGKSGGTGLGLSHAWQTVRAWEGRLLAKRLTQGGTEIVIELPSEQLARESQEPIRGAG